MPSRFVPKFRKYVGIAVCSWLAAASPGLAQEEDDLLIRKRTVGEWLVEYGSEGDGGRMVRLSRATGSYRLELYESFWRGNGGTIFRASASRNGEGCGSAEWREGWRTTAAPSAVRARFHATLRECTASPAEARSALKGYERAYALTAAWARDAKRATLAEIDAILGDGQAPAKSGGE